MMKTPSRVSAAAWGVLFPFAIGLGEMLETSSRYSAAWSLGIILPGVCGFLYVPLVLGNLLKLRDPDVRKAQEPEIVSRFLIGMGAFAVSSTVMSLLAD
jgi:hypothetical protein